MSAARPAERQGEGLPAHGADATLDNALSACVQFGLKRDEAIAQARQVCQAVAGW